MDIIVSCIYPQVLSGQKIWTSIASQETTKLWRPFRKAIIDKEGLSPKKYFSIGRYGKEMAYGAFTIDTYFEKSAAITEPLTECPDGFEEIRLEGGLYAIFTHSGPANKFQVTLQNFMMNWLPRSNYGLDARAHFETFDESYDPFDESSLELVHIPIIEKLH